MNRVTVAGRWTGPAAQARLARAARRALAAVGRPASELDVAIVDDAEIRRLNRAWRGVPRRTDVLAFPLEDARGPSGLVGQVVISVDAARRQARRLGVPLAVELELLVTHGTLHLVGWDDRDPVEAELMHRRERRILGHTPAKLWQGLLGRPGESEPRGLRDRPGESEPRGFRGRPGESEPRPSRTGHPRLKPDAKSSLQ